jgi:RHS repeat-associated protein
VREVVEIAAPDQATAVPPAPSSAAGSLTRQHFVPVAQDSTSSGTYLYDGSGNIKSIGTDTFIYDSLGRLKEGTVQGNQQSYTYDAFGNRLTATRASGAVGCAGGTACEAAVTVLAQSNHLSGVTYDEAGNVTSGFGAVYTYDGTGMVTGATVGSDQRDFAYTADDERIAVKQGLSWTWSVRDQGGKVLREFTSLETSSSPLALSSHTWSKDYIWRDGLLLASVSQSASGPTTYHYHLDHLGTPRLITREGGVLVGKHTYYPFGAEMALTPSESATELMKFTGHERDVVAGDNHSVDYMHARLYNANLGRFLSVDSVTGSANNPRSWNRYSYTFNNPLTRVDLDGRDVTVAPEMRAAVSYGNAHSLLFRDQYLRLDRDHNVTAIIHSEFTARSGTRAHSDPLPLERDSSGRVLHAGEISYIPFSAIRTEAGAIAHELNHLTQELNTGHTVQERVSNHDPDIFLNAAAGPRHYESFAVLEFERQVQTEFGRNIEYLPVGREVVRNMLVLPPAQQ